MRNSDYRGRFRENTKNQKNPKDPKKKIGGQQVVVTTSSGRYSGDILRGGSSTQKAIETEIKIFTQNWTRR